MAARVAAVLQDAAEPSAEELAQGSPYLLDAIEELPPTAPARIGLSFHVYRIPGPGQAPVALPLSWDGGVPTQDTLAGMVASGQLPPGRYRVVIRKGRATLRPITFDIGAPVHAPGSPAVSSGLSDVAGALSMLRSLGLLGGLPGTSPDVGAKLEEISRALAAETKAREEIAQAVVQLSAAVRELQELAASFATGDEKPKGAGFDFTELGKEAIRRLLPGPVSSPPAVNGHAANGVSP